jgi:hypothetical protein
MINKQYNAWLDPSGKLIEVDLAGHIDYASDYLHDIYGPYVYEQFQQNNVSNATELLHKMGWVKIVTYFSGDTKILGGTIDLTRPKYNTVDPPMNAAQMRTAKRLCADLNIDFYHTLNDKRFW